jgi:hypothetical protein
MTNVPSIRSYGKYSSENYGAHTLRVELGVLTVWFSYQTPVAFRLGFGGELVIRENDWGRTTGKHLNWISSTIPRVSGEEFNRRFSEVLAKLEE